MKKGIATAPGQPTLHVELTTDEIERIDLDIAEVTKKTVSKLPARIKELAGEKILAIAPEWKQRNMLAGAIGLVEVNGARSQAQEDKLKEYQAVWKRVEVIRGHSDSLEAQVVKAIADGDDATLIDIQSGWPE